MPATPGPWRFDPAHNQIVTDATIIATLDAPYPMMRDELRANARLLAKAPELHAALIAFLAYADANAEFGDADAIRDAMRDEARALLADIDGASE